MYCVNYGRWNHNIVGPFADYDTALRYAGDNNMSSEPSVCEIVPPEPVKLARAARLSTWRLAIHEGYANFDNTIFVEAQGKTNGDAFLAACKMLGIAPRSRGGEWQFRASLSTEVSA